MSYIIENLKYLSFKLCGKGELEDAASDAIDGAIIEIERLLADLATQQGCCDGAAAQDAHVRREREEHRAEVEKLRAEIERLREALQEAACACPSFENHCASTWARQDGCAHMTARKALEDKP